MAEGYHDALMRRLGMIDALGSNETRLSSGVRNAFFNQNDINAGPQISDGVARNPGANYAFASTGAKGSLQSFINAISGQESGNNYGARNRDSGAMGKYQIMPANIQGSGGWDKEALGYNISTQQFMQSPQLQEAIAQYKLKGYYNKYGPAGAAVAWYAGPGVAPKYLANPSRYGGSQGNYPSIASYVNSVLGAMR